MLPAASRHVLGAYGGHAICAPPSVPVIVAPASVAVEVPHTPIWQMPLRQTLPHAPQLRGSFLGSVQYCLPSGACVSVHAIVPVWQLMGGGVWHTPLPQNWFAAQARPHAPQFARSTLRSTQMSMPCAFL